MTKAEQREYMKRYAEENREQINANARRRYIKNHDKIRARQKEIHGGRKMTCKDCPNIPCKIGDEVWTIAQYKGVKQARKGKVSEMYYVGEEMLLTIVVWHLARGEWGKKVFPTYEEAQRALEEGETTEERCCTTCKHMVSCEPNPFGTCDGYEGG